MYSQQFLEKMGQKLEQQKTGVLAEIKKLTQPEETMENPNSEDLAADATEDIMEESLLKVHRLILDRIEDALGRIKDGTYGRCIECGAIIAEADLEKEPWIEYCDKCVSKK
jgi:RNA polymerase-binding transcription factor DksA